MPISATPTAATLEKISTHELINVASSAKVPVSSLYQQGPAVIVFLRRWGCKLCRGHAKSLSTNLAPALAANGNSVNLVAIGLEKLGVEEFVAGNYFDNNKLYIDEGKKCYKDLNLMSFSVFAGMANLLSSGTRAWSDTVNKMGIDGNLKGDGFQLGATFVVGQTGDVWMEHRQTSFGDYASTAGILKVLQEKVEGFKVPEVPADTSAAASAAPAAAEASSAVACDDNSCAAPAAQTTEPAPMPVAVPVEAPAAATESSSSAEPAAAAAAAETPAEAESSAPEAAASPAVDGATNTAAEPAATPAVATEASA